MNDYIPNGVMNKIPPSVLIPFSEFNELDIFLNEFADNDYNPKYGLLGIGEK